LLDKTQNYEWLLFLLTLTTITHGHVGMLKLIFLFDYYADFRRESYPTNLPFCYHI